MWNLPLSCLCLTLVATLVCVDRFNKMVLLGPTRKDLSALLYARVMSYVVLKLRGLPDDTLYLTVISLLQVLVG